jgi:hypothetical protein
MKKTAFSVMLVLLLLAGLVVATSAAGLEGVVVNPYFDGLTYYVDAGDVVVIQSRRGACSPGLVRAGIVATNYELTLDGEIILAPEDVDELWDPIAIYDSEPWWAERCVGEARPAYAYWRSFLSELKEGMYVLGCRVWIDHPLTSGTDMDGDGKIDILTPETFLWETTNTIIVEEEE